MSSGLLATVDGEPVPLHDLSWVKRAPCGCVVTVILAEIVDPRYGHLIPTEDAAWADLYDDKDSAVLRRDKAAGYTISLMRCGPAVDAMKEPCTHDRSAWQRDERSPEGYVWALPSRPARRTDKAHLTKPSESYSVPLCGGVRGRPVSWDFQFRAVRDHMLCTRCVKARDAMVTA